MMNARRAFTLLELLVVIAIIAILAALLLPALSRAKQSSLSAVDLNNLKQLGVSMQIAAADNADVMPWPNWLSGDVANNDPQGWLYTLDPSASGAAQFQAQTGSFWPILGEQKIFFCPIDDTNSALFKMRDQQISSYVINGAVCGFDRALYPPVKLSELNPSGVAFWECANNTAVENQTLFNDGSNSPDENVSARHGNYTIYGAFDGSAHLMQLAVWSEKAEETNQNILWCFPGSPDGR